MARPNLTTQLRELTEKFVALGAENAALRNELAAIKNPPPPIATANATQPVALSYQDAMTKAKRLTAVSGIGHSVQSGIVYRGYGRDRVAV